MKYVCQVSNFWLCDLYRSSHYLKDKQILTIIKRSSFSQFNACIQHLFSSLHNMKQIMVCNNSSVLSHVTLFRGVSYYKITLIFQI